MSTARQEQHQHQVGFQAAPAASAFYSSFPSFYPQDDSRLPLTPSSTANQHKARMMHKARSQSAHHITFCFVGHVVLNQSMPAQDLVNMQGSRGLVYSQGTTLANTAVSTSHSPWHMLDQTQMVPSFLSALPRLTGLMAPVWSLG